MRAFSWTGLGAGLLVDRFLFMRFKNNKLGRKHYEKLLRRRASQVVAHLAKKAYEFQVPDSILGGDPTTQPIWTGFFRANWNVSIGEPDFDTVDANANREGSLPKEAAGRYYAMIDPWKAEAFFQAHRGELEDDLKQSVYISNGTSYGGWLNKGGWDEDFGVKTHLRKWPRFSLSGKGSRFMELGMEVIISAIPDAVKSARQIQSIQAGAKGNL